ncbi:MAG: type II secretion system protein [Candidatus Rhabdochlamydia sp.]
MKRKRSFLLLEVVIAITLIGLFTTASLYTLSRSLQAQRTWIQSYEYDRLLALQRIDLITMVLNNLERFNEKSEGVAFSSGPLTSKVHHLTYCLSQNQTHLIKCQMSGDQKRCLLKIIHVKSPGSQSMLLSKEVSRPYTYFLSSPRARDQDEVEGRR